MTALLTTQVSIKIHFFDVDPMNVVYHGNYPRFLEVARSALMDKLDYNYPQMKASGYVWPIVDLRIKYVRPILLNQTILVEAALTEYENRVVITYRIYDASTHQLLTKATTTQVAVKEGNQSMELESPKAFTDRVQGALA
jgi:acyl-CoA thioester hydrolase